MLLARVKGLVVASQKVPSLHGHHLRLIQPEDGSGRTLGEPLVAVDLMAARDGAVAADYSEAAMSAYMKNAELEVGVDVGVGKASATMWTCDLTKQYVAINGDYRS